MAKKFFDIEIGEFDANFGTGANPDWSFAYIIWGEDGEKWWGAAGFASVEEAYEAAEAQLDAAFGNNWEC